MPTHYKTDREIEEEFDYEFGNLYQSELNNGQWIKLKSYILSLRSSDDKARLDEIEGWVKERSKMCEEQHELTGKEGYMAILSELGNLTTFIKELRDKNK
jgi:hypothetical protein